MVPSNGNEMQHKSESDVTTDETPEHDRPVAKFRVKRTVVLVWGLVCVTGLVVAGTYFDVGSQISRLTGPRLVAVTGQITYHGKPVTSGFVQTEYANAKRGGAIGTLDAEGRFSLQTDINGTYHPGAYVGHHKLVVMATSSRGVQVIRHVPAIYTASATTPLVIDVTSDPQRNDFHFTLEGDLDSAPASGASPPNRNSPSPADFVKRLLAGDKNGDGKISKTEASGQLLQNFDRVDSNHDGQIDEQEIRALAARFGHGANARRSRPQSSPVSPSSDKTTSPRKSSPQ